MSFTLNLKGFIITFINNCPIVKSSRLDSTIKAIINNYSNNPYYNIFIPYLNKIRIIYYLKRLEYKDKTKAKEYKGKPLIYLRYCFVLIYHRSSI